MSTDALNELVPPEAKKEILTNPSFVCKSPKFVKLEKLAGAVTMEAQRLLQITPHALVKEMNILEKLLLEM